MIEPGNARMPEKADWILRFVAEIIDYILWSLSFVPLTIGLILPWLVEDGTMGAVAAAMGIFFSLVAMVGLALSYTNGRSVGKRLMGTQVVLLDGTPPNWAYNFLLRELSSRLSSLARWVVSRAGSARWSTTCGRCGTKTGRRCTTRW